MKNVSYFLQGKQIKCCLLILYILLLKCASDGSSLLFTELNISTFRERSLILTQQPKDELQVWFYCIVTLVQLGPM